VKKKTFGSEYGPAVPVPQNKGNMITREIISFVDGLCYREFFLKFVLCC
jgi:hypothetical protein